MASLPNLDDVQRDEKKYLPLEKPPYHVGIIMDGNGRWAKANGKTRLQGHQAGTENLRRTLESSVEFGVKMLTIYAFSTENWKRPPLEVMGLMKILLTGSEMNVQSTARLTLSIGKLQGYCFDAGKITKIYQRWI